jgi:hypothetical protein
LELIAAKPSRGDAGDSGVAGKDPQTAKMLLAGLAKEFLGNRLYVADEPDSVNAYRP